MRGLTHQAESCHKWQPAPQYPTEAAGGEGARAAVSIRLYGLDRPGQKKRAAGRCKMCACRRVIKHLWQQRRASPQESAHEAAAERRWSMRPLVARPAPDSEHGYGWVGAGRSRRWQLLRSPLPEISSWLQGRGQPPRAGARATSACTVVYGPSSHGNVSDGKSIPRHALLSIA
jgi:hypothetical protein